MRSAILIMIFLLFSVSAIGAELNENTDITFLKTTGEAITCLKQFNNRLIAERAGIVLAKRDAIEKVKVHVKSLSLFKDSQIIEDLVTSEIEFNIVNERIISKQWIFDLIEGECLTIVLEVQVPIRRLLELNK